MTPHVRSRCCEIFKLGQFLKKRSMERYRSARDFCTKAEGGISYPQYSRYEAGDQLPNLDQAIRIFQLLQIPLVRGLIEWCRAQVSIPEGQQQLDELLARFRQEALQGGPAPTLSAQDGAAKEDIGKLSLNE